MLMSFRWLQSRDPSNTTMSVVSVGRRYEIVSSVEYGRFRHSDDRKLSDVR